MGPSPVPPTEALSKRRTHANESAVEKEH